MTAMRLPSATIARLALILIGVTVVASDVGATVLRCDVRAKINSLGQRDLRLHVMLPERSDYRFDFGIVDGVEKLKKLGAAEFLGRAIPKGLGKVDIATRLPDGTFSKAQRYSLIVTQDPEVTEGSVRALYIGEGTLGLFPGVIVAELGADPITVSVADFQHLPGAITLYEGTCD